MSCIFCKIIKKELPSNIIFENEDFIAFNDISPKANTHILLVPKRHIASIIELPESDAEMMGKMIITAKKIATNAGLSSYRLVFNSGPDAGQEVPHLHLHLLGGNELGSIA